MNSITLFELTHVALDVVITRQIIFFLGGVGMLVHTHEKSEFKTGNSPHASIDIVNMFTFS